MFKEQGQKLMKQNCDWVEPANGSVEAKEAADWAKDWVLGLVSLSRFRV
jgi:hypothetical protein